MSKVAKQIIVILVLLLGVSIFFALSSMSQKVSLEETKSKLESEVAQLQQRELKQLAAAKELGKKLEEAQAQEAKLKQQYTNLNDQVQSLESDRNEWKSRFNDLRTERDSLVTQIQELQLKQQVIAQQAPRAQVAEQQPQQQQPVFTMPQMPEIPAGEMEERYWAEVLKEKAGLELKLAELQSELSGGVVEVGELKKINSDLSLELSSLKNEKEEIERKIKYSEDLANTLSIDLAREKNDKRYVSRRLDTLKEENAQLRMEVKKLTSSRMGLEKNIARLKEDKDKIERSLAETESVIQNRIDEVIDIKRTLDRRLEPISSLGKPQEIELPPIIVSAQPFGNRVATASSGNVASVGFNGRILSINNENNFAIVDIGEANGIHVGDTLNVYRQDKYVAGLEVIQVRGDISAADIKNASTRIRVGDIVR